MSSPRAREARGTELRRGGAFLRAAERVPTGCHLRSAFSAFEGWSRSGRLAVYCACSLIGLATRRAEAQEAPDAGERARDTVPNGSIPNGSTIDPGTHSPFFPKTLLRQQRLPENLQGWVRERRAAREAAGGVKAETPAPSTAPRPAAPPEPDEPRNDESRHPLRSFEKDGVTVLSNRGIETAAAAPAPVLAAVRVAPTPRLRVRPPGETEVDPPEITETRSLRALDAARVSRPTERESYTWPLIAVATGGLGLAALWLRRRNDS